MKRLYTILYIRALAVLLLATLVACSGNGFPFSVGDIDTPPEAKYLNVLPTTPITFEATGGSTSISITSNDTWSIANSAYSWLTCSKTSGSGDASITLTASENTSSDERTATLTITGADKTVTINITQAGAKQENYLTIKVDGTSISSSTTLTFEADSKNATKNIAIESNTTWNIAKSGDTSWFTLSKEGNGSGEATITVTITADNATTSEKTATLTIIGSDKTYSINLTQKGATPYLNVDDTPLSFDANGETKTLTISSNTTWTISNSASSWLTCSKGEGSGNANITLTANKNTTTSQQNGEIIISGAGKTYTIKVSQAAGVIIPGEGDNNLPNTQESRRQQ